MSNKAIGILICIFVSIPAFFLGKLYPVIGGPVFSIIIGMILAQILGRKISEYREGTSIVSKKVLQYAVILLGFGLNLSMIIKVGKTSLPIIISTITISLVISYILAKTFKIPTKIATLVGVGSSICGGSAIAATAPIIHAENEEIAQAISVIFLFNVIAALIFPTMGDLIGFSNSGFAIFAGTAVNDTSSVTAAASSWDSIHNTGTAVLDAATVVKLTRTLAIIPITFVLSIYYNKIENEDNRNFNIIKLVPKFIIYFIFCSVFTTIINSMISGGVLSEQSANLFNNFFAFMKNTSKYFIILAMGAIGINTDIKSLIRSGFKPILLGFSCWVGIILVSLIFQNLIGIM